VERVGHSIVKTISRQTRGQGESKGGRVQVCRTYDTASTTPLVKPRPTTAPLGYSRFPLSDFLSLFFSRILADFDSFLFAGACALLPSRSIPRRIELYHLRRPTLFHPCELLPAQCYLHVWRPCLSHATASFSTVQTQRPHSHLLFRPGQCLRNHRHPVFFFLLLLLLLPFVVFQRTHLIVLI
jgi:hypothetical protein